MDPQKVVEALKDTLHPHHREEAEAKLNEMLKIIGFSPLLLQIVVSQDFEIGLRQASVIYLKNMCTKWWKKDLDAEGAFFIHENDKVLIRENIVEAITHAPEVLRNQLNVIVFQIFREDFPERWPGVIDKIRNNFGSDPNAWMGALQTLYQLAKRYEYKKPEERGPILDAMKIFLPAMTQLFHHTLSDNDSAHFSLLEKQCLKVVYALTQYSLPLDLFDESNMDTWMKFMQLVLERRPPETTLEVDEFDRPELPWWKAKKWALHVLSRIFERYGSPGVVTKEYSEFAEKFLRTYAVGSMHILLKVLDEYRNGQYVTPRVIQLTLHFLEQGVGHSQTWRVMKDAYEDLLKDVIFPLMCFTQKDQELWGDDANEYVRQKFNMIDDFLSPSSAAQCFLHSTCSKRKQVLQKTMVFCHGLLANNDAQLDPRKKDGALHIIGSLSSALLKRKMFKDQLEPMIVTHVFPEFESEHAFMRARAIWVVHHLGELRYKSDQNLEVITNAMIKLLGEDRELPVRVEAAFALQSIICEQEKVEKRCEPHIHTIIRNLLQLVHETENDELTTVVQKIICLYWEQVVPFATEITKSLAMTFLKMLSDKDLRHGRSNDEEAADNRVVAAMGVLSTIETVLDTMEEQRDITKQLEGLVVPVIGRVLSHRDADYYDEIFSIMYSLTCQEISPQMWDALPLIKDVFDDNASEFFTEMMPVIHNFCTIDTDAFLFKPQNLEIMYGLCKKALAGGASEDAESHAAKLLEVLILQCRGRIDHCFSVFIETALSRLTKELKTSELRTMCLQVAVAGIYYNPTLLFQTLENMRFPDTTESVTEQFFRQWLKDTNCILGIHDRRIAVLAWCAVMDAEQRPAVLSELAPQILPSLITILQGLTRAYRNRGDGESSDGSNSDAGDDEDSDYEQEELASSEDEVDDESAEYLAMPPKKGSVNGQDDDSETSDEETALEIYTSSFDVDSNGSEYFIFKQVLKKLEAVNDAWYHQLVSGLTDDQRKSLQEIFTAADQRQAEAESKKIEKSGGYQFNTTNVPTSFNFALN